MYILKCSHLQFETDGVLNQIRNRAVESIERSVSSDLSSFSHLFSKEIRAVAVSPLLIEGVVVVGND
jgi:hypothetical protein